MLGLQFGIVKHINNLYYIAWLVLSYIADKLMAIKLKAYSVHYIACTVSY